MQSTKNQMGHWGDLYKILRAACYTQTLGREHIDRKPIQVLHQFTTGKQLVSLRHGLRT